MGNYCLMGTEFQFGVVVTLLEKVLEVDSGNVTYQYGGT